MQAWTLYNPSSTPPPATLAQFHWVEMGWGRSPRCIWMASRSGLNGPTVPHFRRTMTTYLLYKT
ncbi:hypothetical protein [Oscillatoria sp. HE19RPO]|uniref:hypothetical protein n=1 Tax=Oscillatoria sp. HE19RPO TaxID=2954806 RepID=UPI0020C4B041|nr:hypothetical protein [Oscillatoria sp. HE19RPO]